MQRGNRLLQGGTITQQCLMKALLVRRLCAVSQTGLIIEMICNMMTHLLGSKCRVFCVCEFYLQGHCGGDTWRRCVFVCTCIRGCVQCLVNLFMLTEGFGWCYYCCRKSIHELFCKCKYFSTLTSRLKQCMPFTFWGTNVTTWTSLYVCKSLDKALINCPNHWPFYLDASPFRRFCRYPFVETLNLGRWFGKYPHARWTGTRHDLVGISWGKKSEPENRFYFRFFFTLLFLMWWSCNPQFGNHRFKVKLIRLNTFWMFLLKEHVWRITF